MIKNIRKIICMLLIFTLLLPSALAFASYGQASPDVIEELGIAKKAKFPYFHRNYNRAEFAYILAKLDITYMPVKQDDTIVSDVDKDNAEYASYAVSKGYLSLDEKGNFRPNDKVTYNEAVMAFIKLLGYDLVVQKNGGTASDYAAMAKKIGLTKGVSSSDEILSKETLASMVVNAMEIPQATLVYDGGVIEEGSTILERKNLSVVEAKLLATPTRGIGADTCDEGYINLGGILVKTEKTFDDSLVGRLVHCYISTDGRTNKAVSMVNMSGDSIVLEPEDIYDINITRTQVSFKYGDGKKVNIPHSATIIINGKPGDLTKQIFDVFRSGVMEVIDSDDDGRFDTVDMALCVTELVESVSVSSNAVNTKYTNKRIDFDGNGNNFSVYENDVNVGMSAIGQGSAINIACDAYTVSGGKLTFDYSKAKFIRVYVSNHQLTGMLEYMSDEEYVIDGRGFAPNIFLEELSGMNIKPPLDTTSTYKFTIDAFGTVCDYELIDDNAGIQYGYLLNAGVTSDGFNSEMKVQILNTDSELKVYNVKNKYMLDGERETIEGGYVLPAVLKSRQLVRYKVSDELVTVIDTAVLGRSEVRETSLTLDYDAKETGLRFWGDFNGFEDHRTVVSSDTKVFYVTDDASADESAFKAEDSLVFASSTYYNYESYDIGEMGQTGCILVYANISDDINFMNRSYMLEKVAQVTDDNGDVVTRLYLHGYAGSITKDLADKEELIFTDSSGADSKSLSDLRKGDLVRYGENANGKIVKLERAFTVSEEPTMHIDDLTASGLHYEYGTFYNTNATHFEAVAKSDLSDVTEDEKFVFAYKYPSKIPVYNMIDNTITLYSGDFQKIPTYMNSAEKVTVFIHMGAYAFYSAAVYIWE